MTRPSNEDRIRAALWFAERGFGIFPVWSTTAGGRCRCPQAGECSSPGKHPVTPQGFQDATLDPDRIRTFLSAASDPNYGMVPPERVFAWDVDGEDGPRRLLELEAQLGPLPPTLRTDTANGQHVFLRWPEDLARPTRQMFGFVTRWGSGKLSGYVIGPRSVHPSGAEYKPAADTVLEIAEIPEAWAAATESPSGNVHVGGGRVDPSMVEVGHRHDHLRNTARLYAGTVRDPEALFAAVWTENLRFSQPKTEEEVRRAIGEVLEKFTPDEVREDPETGALIRVVETPDVDLLPPTEAAVFPKEIEGVAFVGTIGECVEALAEGTDASKVGMLGSMIAFCGALIPGRAYFHRVQTSSPFIALVGESSTGRKGTAMLRIQDAMGDAVESVYVNRVIMDGLNSGEGLINTLAYRQTAYPYEPTVGLVFEEEYASLLASRGREGSTLDPKMRSAFDGGNLSNRKAATQTVVTTPYWLPALIAITPVELRRRLEPGALQSGSANRWLYLPVTRRDTVPSNTEPSFPHELRLAIKAAREAAITARGPVVAVEPGVVARLAEYADFLPGASTGVGSDLTRRMSVIAFRVALVHALVERDTSVTLEYLDRALALTEYARRGLDWVFGQTIGNRDAELLLRHLQEAGSLRVRSIAREIVRDPIRRQDAIDELVRVGYAEVVTVEAGARGGRPGKELRPGLRGQGFTPFPVTKPSGEGGFVTVSSEVSSRSASVNVTFVPPLRTPPVFPANEDAGNVSRVTSTESVTEPLFHAQDVVTEPVTKPRETLTEPAKTPQNLEDRTGTWVKPCQAYEEHRSGHRLTADGWVCDTCGIEP